MFSIPIVITFNYLLWVSLNSLYNTMEMYYFTAFAKKTSQIGRGGTGFTAHCQYLGEEQRSAVAWRAYGAERLYMSSHPVALNTLVPKEFSMDVRAFELCFRADRMDSYYGTQDIMI